MPPELLEHMASEDPATEKQLEDEHLQKYAGELGLNWAMVKKAIDDDLKERLKAALGEFDQAFVAA